ncbi:EexN family lipoprotein [Achromobacter sp. NCFB-sbj8-Ac1-l]|uniref:EexN family lipoprotein n=1 Tax=unclassified Achromobacter TaxID=2626865 RepID=UPI004046A359
MTKISALLFLAAVLLVGCGDTDPVQTVDWYKENTPDRLAMLEKCKANPGELAASANCINATTAANHLALDKRGYKQRAPMDFSGK